jgi:hypothetical protein
MPQTTKTMKSKTNQPTADDSAFTVAPCSADLRTPTVLDMMQLLQWAGAAAANARSKHYNDRDQSTFSDAQDQLERIHEVCLEAISRFPAPMRKSPWVKYAEQNDKS